VKKIAPVLQMLMKCRGGGSIPEEWGTADRELRALLAVATQAKRIAAWESWCEGCANPKCAEHKMTRALARLDRASGGGK
jgi:hypothetical protein